MKKPRYPRSKYNAKRTKVGNITFHSKAEAMRWCELLLLQKAGKIEGLMRQRVYPLRVPIADGSVCIGSYVADFWYLEDGKEVIEDKKGFRTDIYRWKKKHFENQYGLLIRET